MSVQNVASIAQVRLDEIGARINGHMRSLSQKTGIDFSMIFNQTVAQVEETLTSDLEEVPLVETVAEPLPSPTEETVATQMLWSSGRDAFSSLIATISANYGIDPALIEAVVQAESSFNPYAVSSSGASGLMQLMPSTTEALGVADVFDPEQNIDGGVRCLLGQIIRYDGNVLMALAAYNCGAGGLDSRGITDLCDPLQWSLLPEQTRAYLDNIAAILEAAGRTDLLERDYFS